MNSSEKVVIRRNPTRAVRIGSIWIGGGHPIAIQSMCATKTTDVLATVAQVNHLAASGAAIVRIAVDTNADAEALREIRRQTTANLSVDIQENYRLAAVVAPMVDKIRYNPGHLYHHERSRPWQDKVRFLVDVAGKHGCAIRIGINCGSVDPAKRDKYPPHDTVHPMLDSALEHAELLDNLGWTQYCVSLKDSDPQKVIQVNRMFAQRRPDVPIHLGVTEAGIPPQATVKTRIALEPLLREGIGDTIRVSLTVPAEDKHQEIQAARQILDDVAAGRVLDPAAVGQQELNIISCPGCSRVENTVFIELARRVQEATTEFACYPIKIAVMGCRVNGPGETDQADIGLWCGPNFVNLKRGSQLLGPVSYEEIIPRLRNEIALLVAQRYANQPNY